LTGEPPELPYSCPNRLAWGVSPNVRKSHFYPATSPRPSGATWSIFHPARPTLS
jgi:hypothetical protein